MTAAREHILTTTCQLLEMQGYHATGMSEIIERSGSPKGSLYYYFPGGKEDLAAEALNRVGEVVRMRIEAYLAMHEDAAEAVRLFVRLIADNVVISGYTAGGPITTVALETASNSERLRLACDAIYTAWQSAFADRLHQAGLDDARAHQLGMMIVSALEGAIILARTSRSRLPLDSAADLLAVLTRTCADAPFTRYTPDGQHEAGAKDHETDDLWRHRQNG